MANIASLLIGKAKSSGFPGKNVMPLRGIPSCEYGCIVSENVPISRAYCSTDSDEIAKIASKYGFKEIKRPERLATADALTEDTLIHAYESMIQDGPLDIVCLFTGNSPAINIDLVRQGIEVLEKDETYDSAFSVCEYNMFSPLRARKIEKDEIKPFVDLKQFEGATSIRSSQGSVYFCDLSVQIIRARVFEDMWRHPLPFRWQGSKSYPLMNTYGFDIDEKWQKVVIDLWLEENWKLK
tara:strand:- start:2070 stop:2786 length:717 start_codon:yes stop_codon:yes gene_type:complete